MPAVLFPDVEAAFIGAIGAALAARPEPHAQNVAVRNKVPADTAWPTSKRLVVVRDDGGPTSSIRGVARIGVRVWAPSEAEANDLANLVAALVRGWHDVDVRGATAYNPFSVTEESARPCQYFTAELVVIGRKLPAA